MTDGTNLSDGSLQKKEMMNIGLRGGVKESAFERLLLRDLGYRMPNPTHTESRLDGHHLILGV